MPGDIPELPQSLLHQIYHHARAEFPRECCGYILGSGAQAELVVCDNIQDDLHAQDPERFIRTAQDAYSIGGKQLLSFVRSFDAAKPATVLYHSHPRVGAYFSEEDTNAALAASYPVDYLVVDVQDDFIGGAKLFRGDGSTFVQIAEFSGAKI